MLDDVTFYLVLAPLAASALAVAGAILWLRAARPAAARIRARRHPPARL